MPSSRSIHAMGGRTYRSSARRSLGATPLGVRCWTDSSGRARRSTVQRVSDGLRVVIAEDDVLFREGIARLLTDAGFDVVGRAGDAEGFLRKALAHRPDVAVVDIEMPPGEGADGMRAALELRSRLPSTGVLVLSGHYEETYAIDLLGESAEGVGYLLKERVGEVEVFTDAVSRV